MPRPESRDSRARAGKFLCLIASGADVVAARKQAGIDPDRALRIVTESDFAEIVSTIREHLTSEAA